MKYYTLHYGTGLPEKLLRSQMKNKYDSCHNIKKKKLEKTMLSERSQSQKVIYCMILFTQNGQNEKMYRNRKVNGCHSSGEKENGSDK